MTAPSRSRLARRGVSIDQVAAAAGVSMATVSNVLNHPEKVRSATRDRVEQAIEQLGYVRNANARSLAAGLNRTVGLVVIDIGNSLFVDIARGVQREIDHAAFSLVMANSDNDDAVQNHHLDFLSGSRVAGILLAPMREPSRAIERVRRLGTPVVVLNYRSDSDDHCSVLIDNEQAGYLAARHMIELGHERLAFVGGLDELQPVRDRRVGVRRAVAEAPGVSLVEVETENLNADGGAAAGARIVAMPEATRPDGVIAVTDLLGMAIVQVLQRSDLSVPDDVAVMGCDYNSNAWGGTIPLTSVHMHGEDMGSSGLELLLNEFAAPDDHEHERVVLEPSLVARESTVGRAAHG